MLLLTYCVFINKVQHFRMNYAAKNLSENLFNMSYVSISSFQKYDEKEIKKIINTKNEERGFFLNPL
jgi:hypothetical protein